MIKKKQFKKHAIAGYYRDIRFNCIILIIWVFSGYSGIRYYAFYGII